MEKSKTFCFVLLVTLLGASSGLAVYNIIAYTYGPPSNLVEQLRPSNTISVGALDVAWVSSRQSNEVGQLLYAYTDIYSKEEIERLDFSVILTIDGLLGLPVFLGKLPSLQITQLDTLYRIVFTQVIPPFTPAGYYHLTLITHPSSPHVSISTPVRVYIAPSIQAIILSVSLSILLGIVMTLLFNAKYQVIILPVFDPIIDFYILIKTQYKRFSLGQKLVFTSLTMFFTTPFILIIIGLNLSFLTLSLLFIGILNCILEFKLPNFGNTPVRCIISIALLGLLALWHNAIFMPATIFLFVAYLMIRFKKQNLI